MYYIALARVYPSYINMDHSGARMAPPEKERYDHSTFCLGLWKMLPLGGRVSSLSAGVSVHSAGDDEYPDDDCYEWPEVDCPSQELSCPK